MTDSVADVFEPPEIEESSVLAALMYEWVSSNWGLYVLIVGLFRDCQAYLTLFCVITIVYNIV